MKTFRHIAFAFALLFAAAQPATPANKIALFSASCPPATLVGGVCPAVSLNFNTGVYWTRENGYVPLTSVVSTSRASSKTCAYANGTLISVTSNVLCVTDQGALIEEARTNVLPQSQTLDTTWVSSATTVTADQTNAPDGTLTADLLTPTATNTSHSLVASSLSALTVASYTVSAYVKPNGYTKIGYRENTTSGSYATWDCSGSGSVISTNLSTATISALANGWYRITATYTAAVATQQIGWYVLDAAFNSGSGSPHGYAYLANGTSGEYLWGVQLELGAFATSYIPTTTTSTTRAADVPQLIGPALTAALAAKSAFFQTTGVGGGTAPRFIDYGGGANLLYADSTHIQISNATTPLQALIGGAATYSGVVKSAFGMDASSYTAVANAGTKTTQASAWAGNSGATYIGNRADGTRALNGYMQRFALSPVKGVFDGATSP